MPLLEHGSAASAAADFAAAMLLASSMRGLLAGLGVSDNVEEGRLLPFVSGVRSAVGAALLLGVVGDVLRDRRVGVLGAADAAGMTLEAEDDEEYEEYEEYEEVEDADLLRFPAPQGSQPPPSRCLPRTSGPDRAPALAPRDAPTMPVLPTFRPADRCAECDTRHAASRPRRCPTRPR